jgi:hypothetical protein
MTNGSIKCIGRGASIQRNQDLWHFIRAKPLMFNNCSRFHGLDFIEYAEWQVGATAFDPRLTPVWAGVKLPG